MRFLFRSEIVRLNSLLGNDSHVAKEKIEEPVNNRANQAVVLKSKIPFFSRFNAASRTREFEQDYPTFLLSLASSIRTGLDPVSALKTVSEMLPDKSALRIELTKLSQRLDSGESEEDAILSFGESVGHPDVSLLTTSLILARRQGSSLGACLGRLNKVTRQRQSFRRKAKAAVAMQRIRENQ